MRYLGRAGSAEPFATAELRTGESKLVAQRPEQHPIVIDRELHRLAIQREGNVSLHALLPSRHVLLLQSVHL